MSSLTLTVRVDTLKLAAPFRISGYVFDSRDVVVATVSDGSWQGRGEASGVYYLGEDTSGMVAQIEEMRGTVEQGLDRTALQTLMPPGGARNALDCALWELEAKRAGVTVAELAGVAPVRPLVTTFTMGADDPDAMAAGARAYAHARALKMKLTGELAVDIARVRAVRSARPDVWLGVDANQGFAIGDLAALVDALVEQRVDLLEQPLPRGSEADLASFESPIPIAADESLQSLDDVPGLVSRFDVANIKLDKCGGLTEGLAIARAAREHGLEVMVGNMISTSLAMAPAFVLGQLCDIVDLDGPIFLAQDRDPAITYADGTAFSGDAVWGSRAAHDA